MVITLHLCVLCGSEQKEYLLPFTSNTNRLFFITEAESVYNAVRTVSLYKADSFLL